MLTLVGGAGLTGFITSASLLTAGMSAPWLRYPLAAAAGYVAFLGGLRAWLALRQRRFDGDADLSVLDLLGADADASSPVGAGGFGGGGGFSGGGGSAAVDAADAAAGAEAKSSMLAGGLEAAADADEGAVVIVPLVLGAAAVVGVLASFAVLYNAPVLFAEVLLDSAIAAVAYGRLRRHSSAHWTAGVLRRTWKPMLAIGAVLVALGVAIPWLVPGADSIGDLFR